MSPISHGADQALAHVRSDPAFGRLPISFEVNRGQTSNKVQFLSRGRGYELFLTGDETVLSLKATQADKARKSSRDASGILQASRAEGSSTTSRTGMVRMRLMGANTRAEAAGEDQLPGKSNYFIGNDPARWRTDVPTYAKVHYRDIYPGVDLVYYGNAEGSLEHDFIVAAGVDPGRIALQFGEDQSVATDQDGGLVLRTRAGDVKLQRPVAYQSIGGNRVRVDASYAMTADRRIRFQLGEYDHTSTLVIDPVVIFTAVFGGSGNDEAQAVAVDGAANVYVAGITSSLDFPIVNPGPWTNNTSTAFVSKIDPTGTALLYSTYFGSDSTSAYAIKVDGSGRIYVAGSTGNGFPTKNAHQVTFAGGDADAFLAVISPEGNSLVYSTYLGGSKTDYALALALDDSGNAYITGRTEGGFPALHSLQPQDPQGAFVAKFSPAGVLQYSSIYGNVWGQSTAIAVDKYGAAYVTGYTNQPTVQITPNVFRTTCPEECSWVIKLNPAGNSLAYATYLAPNSLITGIALDSDLNAYVGGGTSPGFPAWSSAFQRTPQGGTDGFVAKLNTTGSKLIWCTYLGGSGEDIIYSLALDQYRQVYVTGATSSPNFPLKAPVQTYAGTDTAPWMLFVTTLSGSLGSIVYYSTYFGPTSLSNRSPALAIDKALNVYVVGGNEGKFKATPNALAPGAPGNPGGNNDAFASKLSIMADLLLSAGASAGAVLSGDNISFILWVKNQGPDFAVNVRVTDLLPANTTFVGYDAGGGTCTTPPLGGTGTFTCKLARLEKGATWTSKVTVKVNLPAKSFLHDDATVVSNMQDPNVANNSGSVDLPVD